MSYKQTLDDKVEQIITVALRRMIWEAICRDGQPAGQLVAMSIVSHPIWRPHLERLSALVGVPDDDCSSAQAIMPWETFKHLFWDTPQLVTDVRTVLSQPSPRLSVCTVLIFKEMFEIKYLMPLPPSNLN